MADGMFGSPTGTSAAIQDEYRSAATQEALGRLAMQPVEQRLNLARAEQAELALMQEKQMAGLMQQQKMAASPELAALVESGTAGPAGANMERLALGERKQNGSIADRFDELAVMAADSGLVTKAGEAAKVAALLRSRQAAADSSIATQRLNQLKGIRENAELIGQLIGGATDQASWEYQNALYEAHTGRRSPWADQPYSSELVKQINSQAMSAKERVDAEEKKLQQASTDAYRKRRLAQIDSDRAIRAARAATAKAREERLAKAGGKGAGSPATGDVSQARTLVQKEFPDIEGADLKEAAFTIAAEAKALAKKNPALDMNQALRQAFAAAKKAGDFKVIPSNVLGYGGKATFSGAGKTPQTPASLPKKPTDLVSGRYYTNASGAVGKWTGKGFEVVGDLLSGDNSDPDDEEDLDDEEEE